MKKKVKFEYLKPGNKCRLKRKLYIKDGSNSAVRLSDGEIVSWEVLCNTDMVTPVKVQIKVVG